MISRRIIIGISGASGFQYGVKALELLKGLDLEVHLVVSRGAEKTCRLETDYRMEDVISLADKVHPIDNLGASIASGSFHTLGMPGIEVKNQPRWGDGDRTTIPRGEPADD